MAWKYTRNLWNNRRIMLENSSWHSIVLKLTPFCLYDRCLASYRALLCEEVKHMKAILKALM